MDNEDGSQWFHLLNEEFTEKLLKGINNKIKIFKKLFYLNRTYR